MGLLIVGLKFWCLTFIGVLKRVFLGSGFEPFKVCWLDCSLKFSISENKALKSCSTRRLTEQD